MVRVPVEVRSGVDDFVIAVQAESIRKAVSLVEARYPDGEVGVRFPIDPEYFFVEDLTARAGIVGFGQTEEIAA
jgi:hypothetical protein